MRLSVGSLVALALATAVAGCGGNDASSGGDSQEAGEPAAASAPAVADAASQGAQPPAAFAQCRSCHAVVAGQNGVGPSLHGVFGARAASRAGFSYSPALQGSGLTWDDATLDKWLQGPTSMVPGTRMILAPIPDPARRKAIIDYLATLK